ncbi:MAG: penicillin acylase family protein [Janthinobacterium lividum]
MAVTLVLAGALGAGLLWWSLPGSRMQAAVPGLSAAVRIGIDADGVPRIEAATALDGAAGLGFVHARDRLFQMELMRRAASGRLSELVGASTLRLDRFNRVLGLRRRAEAEVATLEPGTRAMLEAYARGVNAWIAARGRFAAPEFLAIGRPEPWTVADSLLWGKTMALYLSGNWRQELALAALGSAGSGGRSPEALKALWPAQDRTQGPDARLSDPGSDRGVDPVKDMARRLAGLVPAFPAPFTLPDTASNEWAVDGAHSATGAPLLAGDPHLAFGMPGIWYLARITTPEGVLAGATAPGVPFLILGHNGRIAWTFTTTGADTQDVFVETLLEDGGTEGRYAAPGGPLAFARREERIRVRGAADDVLTVRETRHGPVLSDLDDSGGSRGGPRLGGVPGVGPGVVLAVAMASLQPGDTAAAGLLALNRAGSLDEARAAAPRISAPVQNLLVADRTGIGQFTTRRVPVRRSGDGMLPVAGADGAADWTGFAEGEALPHQVNPASGRLVNANERVPGGDVFMGQAWFGDWRARRIRALLDGGPQSVAGFAAMQVDVVSAFAQAVLPRLLRVPPADAGSRAALLSLRAWDGSMRMDLAQPLLFNAWMRRFETALAVRAGVPAGMLGAQPDAVARALGVDGAEGAGADGADAEGTWCGDGCDAMLSAALSDAVRDVDADAGGRGDARGDASWGAVHEAEFAHPLLGRLPWVGGLARWRIRQPGDDGTLFRGSARAPGWTSVHGPSFRGVYDLAALDRSVFALAPGQSGHPLRRHAADLLTRWRDGTTLRLGPEAAAAEVIELRPGSDAAGDVRGSPP